MNCVCFLLNSKFIIFLPISFTGITKWVKGWRKNGWKLRDGSEVKVKSAVERLDNLLTASKVQVVWVRIISNTGSRYLKKSSRFTLKFLSYNNGFMIIIKNIFWAII